jgi:hypothetical protein
MSIREKQMADAKNGVKWAVSSHVRATYTADGAVLLDINKGICYSLDAVAARLWVTMETSQTGITLEGIVCALETHFEVHRRELESDTTEWLDKLQRMGLVYPNGRAVPSKDARGGS